jgi:hypothetical protein
LLSSKEAFGGSTWTEGEASSYENIYAFNKETQFTYFANGNKLPSVLMWFRSSYYYSKVSFTISDAARKASFISAKTNCAAFPAFDIG